jgi:hypothetical protein
MDAGRLYETKSAELTERDLDFVVSVAAPDFRDRERLRRLVQEDRAFRKALIGNEKLFRQVIGDEETVVRISPGLFFEIVLRRACRDLEERTYFMETAGSESVPVFCSKKAAAFLSDESILEYLVCMLSSFARIESFVVPVKTVDGVWRHVKVSDIDIDALVRLCSLLDEENRFAFYKRIADLCLFLLGVFPEYAVPDSRYYSRVGTQARIMPKLKRSAADYEREGTMFYKLAGEHQRAKLLGLEDLLFEMGGNFNLARGCLNFVSEHYLKLRKSRLFGIGSA